MTLDQFTILGAGFAIGYISSLFSVWWGFRRAIEVKHPELLKKKKAEPVGEVEFSNYNSSAR